jgi:regulator of protease activity HflC (stomatin/prohibitin superfamily)
MANSDDKVSARPDARRERLAKALRANLIRRKAAARAAGKGDATEVEQGRRDTLEPEPKD